MTATNHTIAVQVPELGPFLGKLLTGLPRSSNPMPIDDIRLQLVDRVLGKAGKARALAHEGKRDQALRMMDRGMWLFAWEEVVSAVSERLIKLISAHLELEFRAVKMPRRVRKKFRIDEVERRAIEVRLGAAGAGLIPAVDMVQHLSDGAARRSPMEVQFVKQWTAAQARAARQLEASWIDLENGIADELAAWMTVADSIAAWRRPLWPLAIAGVVLTAAAVFLGMAVGGMISVPAPLVPTVSWLTDFINRLLPAF